MDNETNTAKETVLRRGVIIRGARAGETGLIEELLSDIQVQRARLRGTLRDICNPNKTITRANIETYIIDTGQIYARAAASFDFSRRISATFIDQINWDDVSGALNNLDFYDRSYPGVYIAMNLLESKGVSPQRFRPSTRP